MKFGNVLLMQLVLTGKPLFWIIMHSVQDLTDGKQSVSLLHLQYLSEEPDGSNS